MSSYYTCSSSIGNRTSSCDCSSIDKSFKHGEQKFCNYLQNNTENQFRSIKNHINLMTKENEDSGVSSRKSDLSPNIHCELSAIEQYENNSHLNLKEDSSDNYSDLSKR